jgi:hypothetical protein
MNLNKIKKKVNYSLVQKELKTANFQTIKSSLIIKQEGKSNYKQHTTLKFPEILKRIKKSSKNQFKDGIKKISTSEFKNYNQNKEQLIGHLTLNSFQKESILLNSLENTKLKSIFFSFIQMKSFFFKMPKDKKEA